MSDTKISIEFTETQLHLLIAERKLAREFRALKLREDLTTTYDDEIWSLVKHYDSVDSAHYALTNHIADQVRKTQGAE